MSPLLFFLLPAAASERVCKEEREEVTAGMAAEAVREARHATDSEHAIEAGKWVMKMMYVAHKLCTCQSVKAKI